MTATKFAPVTTTTSLVKQPVIQDNPGMPVLEHQTILKRNGVGNSDS